MSKTNERHKGAQTFKILIMEAAHKLLGSGEIESFCNLQLATC